MAYNKRKKVTERLIFNSFRRLGFRTIFVSLSIGNGRRSWVSVAAYRWKLLMIREGNRNLHSERRRVWLCACSHKRIYLVICKC